MWTAKEIRNAYEVAVDRVWQPLVVGTHISQLSVNPLSMIACRGRFGEGTVSCRGAKLGLGSRV